MSGCGAQRYGQGSLFRRTVLEHIAEEMLAEIAAPLPGFAASGEATPPADSRVHGAAQPASCPITRGDPQLRARYMALLAWCAMSLYVHTVYQHVLVRLGDRVLTIKIDDLWYVGLVLCLDC